MGRRRKWGNATAPCTAGDFGTDSRERMPSATCSVASSGVPHGAEPRGVQFLLLTTTTAEMKRGSARASLGIAALGLQIFTGVVLK